MAKRITRSRAGCVKKASDVQRARHSRQRHTDCIARMREHPDQQPVRRINSSDDGLGAQNENVLLAVMAARR